MAITLATYETPAFTVDELDEVEIVPAVIVAVAAAVGVSIAFVTMVCTACGWGRCRDFSQTLATVAKWLLPFVDC